MESLLDEGLTTGGICGILTICSFDHEFWADSVSLRDDATVDVNRVHSHNQIADLYLLGLAVRHGGTLVTFDQNISLDAVRGATQSHLTIL